MAEAPKFNLRNPAVKRIMQEIKEIRQDTSGDFLAEALETDIFEWHFVIRGPPDTEFDGGVYHGRILLPADYPFKPPSFMMLTPNGRFETNMKICLSISSHHPEHWQPSWSVRTALTALIAFMPSPGAGALGALDFPKEERRVMAARSQVEPPRFGSADRQRVTDEMHGRMRAIAAAKEAERRRTSADPGAQSPAVEASGPATGEAAVAALDEQQRQQQQRVSELQAGASSEGDATAKACGPQITSASAPGDQECGPAGASHDVAGPAAAGSSSSSGPSAIPLAETSEPGCSETGKDNSRSSSLYPPSGARPSVTATASSDLNPSGSPCPPQPALPAPAAAVAAAASGGGGAVPLPRVAAVMHPVAHNAAAAAAAVTSTDHMLTALMWALYVGIGAILLRKVMGVIGFDLSELMQ